MFTPLEKSEDLKSRTASNVVTQKNSVENFEFVNNRPEAITQRKLQEAANNVKDIKSLQLTSKQEVNPDSLDNFRIRPEKLTKDYTSNGNLNFQSAIVQRAPLSIPAYSWEDRTTLLQNHVNQLLTTQILDSVHDINLTDAIMRMVEIVAPNLTVVIGLADAIQIHGLNLSNADATSLSGMTQVTSVADLVQVEGLNLPVADRLQLGTLGAHGLAAAPTLAEIVLLDQSRHSIANILQLAQQEIVTTPAQLLTLANSVTDRNSLWFEWQESNHALQSLQEGWSHWPINGIFNDIYANLWAPATVNAKVLSTKQPSPTEIQNFLVAKAGLQARLNRINAFIPALDEGRTQLTLCDTLTGNLLPVQTMIQKMLIYYNTPSVARTAILGQQVILNTAITDIATEKTQITLEKTAYNALLDISITQSAANLALQQAHGDTLGAIPTPAAINAVITPYQTLAFQGTQAYPNLKLTQTAEAHAFWQSLLPLEKQRLNTKLAGFPVTAWNQQGYPGTRQKQHGYTGATIQIPTLAGFPVAVSGEVVHDWIFNTQNHGQPAAKMDRMIRLAQAGATYPIMANWNAAPRNVVGGGRTQYGWDNIAVNIVITNGGVLITFYSTV